MTTEDTTATDRGSACNDLLGLAPEREGQPHLYTATGPVPEAGHWYSPAAVREMLAAERERHRALTVAADAALECLEQASTFLSRKARDRAPATVAVLRAALQVLKA